jgi:inner membrane protein
MNTTIPPPLAACSSFLKRRASFFKMLGVAILVLLLLVPLGMIRSVRFIALQLQDYSLLFGTAGLFVVLAAIFHATRKIDWYTRDENGV